MSDKPIRDWLYEDFQSAHVIIDRRPKACTHTWDDSEHWDCENPNYANHGEMLLGMREIIRAARTILGEWKDEQKHLPKDERDDPEASIYNRYVVRLCAFCEAKRFKAWQEAHWDQSSYYRSRRFVHALALYESNSDNFTATNMTQILDMVRSYHLTRGDFWDLDQKPQNWGYEIHFVDDATVYTWHWKLRRLRNSMAESLFAALDRNQADGYIDDQKMPDMPIAFQL